MSKSAGGGNTKSGRNSSWCKIYRDRNVRMRNKIRKVKRHFKRFPEDTRAQNWLEGVLI